MFNVPRIDKNERAKIKRYVNYEERVIKRA